MNFLKIHKTKIIIAIGIIAVLAFALFYGGNFSEPIDDAAAPKQQGEVLENSSSETEKPDIKEEQPKKPSIEEQENITYSKQNGMEIDQETGKDKYNTEPVPEGKPIPTEPEPAKVTSNELTCTLSVRCDTAVGKNSDKSMIIPPDGVIFEEQTVAFYEGESVFNLLSREMKKNKIHLEFVNTPIYNSAYIEGIANLYEFDCGELSGWMYKVNGWFPNYGASRYQLKQGDRVEWVYTCDLGKDVGGEYSARNGN